ncbi:MAG TPA: hypothetical protein PLI95_14035 [Polyangiaceae bacterium]|nr:hypothetical protein [Polyangiaceae bacterium]
MASDDDRGEKTGKASEPSEVRNRVKRHLRKLLIPGVIGLGACKSSDPGVVCDPMPPPATADPTAPPGGDQDASIPQPPDTNSPPPVVCDPMPPPAPRPPKK